MQGACPGAQIDTIFLCLVFGGVGGGGGGWGFRAMTVIIVMFFLFSVPLLP